MAGWVERRINAEVAQAPEVTADESALKEALAEIGPLRVSTPKLSPLRARREILEAVVAAKIMRDHLSNRLQTSFALAMNLSSRDEATQTLLLEAIAGALSSGSATPRPVPEAILASIRAPEGAAETVRRAIESPRPFAAFAREVEEAGVQADAFAFTVVALPRPSVAEQAYVDYLAARFALSAETVRGVRRRFRR